DDFIDGALFAINLTNVSSTTKFSCFFMFGLQPRLPFDVEKLVQQAERRMLCKKEINLENGKCQLCGRVGKILRRKTNLKDVKIYKPQQLSSGDDQDGLSAAQNEEVETPLSAAVLTKASQHGEATRPPPNRTHEQTRDTVPSLSSTGK
ncbi:unnamed protein product, partial [Porites evermanni]